MENKDYHLLNGYMLSDPLIGRISSLCQGLLPYRFLINGEISAKAYSPERAQILLAIVGSNLDTATCNKIFSRTNFTQSYLRKANLKSSYLNGIDLRGSEMSGADFSNSTVKNSYLNETDLTTVNFFNADLSESTLTGANIEQTNFTNTNLSNTFLLSLKNADFETLAKAYTLYECTNLWELEEELKLGRPCLFTKEGCEKFKF